MMKNNYSFELLTRKEIYSGSNKSDLFFSMLELTKCGAIYPVDTFVELEDKLSDNQYYIAHNLVFRKGKKVLFNGELVVSYRNDLIDFLAKSIESNDLRNLLISPVFDESPSYVVSINDESFYFFI